uniref:ARID domain-containing protein n=1 Tax=Trichogramma kaykai TaxID=54128 RepID=A0ABD2WG46_9HYME
MALPIQQQISQAAMATGKDPVSNDRLRDAFIQDLHRFHDTRGTSFKKLPKIDGKEVDLYKLYTLVTARNGWISVNNKNEWTQLCEDFHLPSGCVNSGVGLKQIYLRYLDRYEKVHFLGEDGHQADDDDDDSRHRKWNARSLHSVPLTYNHNQHNIAESLREYNGLSSNLYKPTSYDKLALSLLSPLPNEQDFAINVCNLLSSEGKHLLRLDRYPRIINHLLAHAGVYDSPGTRQLFVESYSKVRNYSINSFWHDVVEDGNLLQLTDERIYMKKSEKDSGKKIFGWRKFKDPISTSIESTEQGPIDLDDASMDIERDLNNDIEIISEHLAPHLQTDVVAALRERAASTIKFDDDDRELFCVGRTLGTQDLYGQRVLQIATILRNLSFTTENAPVLAKNISLLRFVMLCVRASWNCLHQLGFDTFGNIANEIVLREVGENMSKMVLESITKGIHSQDRFIVISCLDVLNKISQQDANEEMLTLSLDDQVYETICRFLALSDIALLVYTLECLYALTSLGERPCTSVSRVRGAIDTLVALVTVEAQSYGPKACILMKVVETVSSVPASSQPQTPSTPQTPQATIGQHGPSPHSQQVVTVPVQHSTVPAAPTATSVSSSSSASPTPHQTISVSSLIASQQQHMAVKIVPQQQVTNTATVTQPSTQQVHQVQTTTPIKNSNTANNSRPSTPKNTAAAKAAASAQQQQYSHRQVIEENDQFAVNFLRANYEPAVGGKVEQEEVYKKYFNFCTQSGRRGVIAPAHFPRCVKSVFGGINSGSEGINNSKYYEGISVRANPNPVVVCASTSTINNAVGTATTSNNAVSMSTMTTTTTPVKVSVAHPHLSHALLASGTQQPIVSSTQPQQPQTVQVILKEDPIRSGNATSSSIIKSLLATKVTVGNECVQSSNTTTTASISANQLLTAGQVAQRQQQQQQLKQRQQQLQQVQTIGTTPLKIISVKPNKTVVAVKKVQRLNGAKLMVSNNGEKIEAMEVDNGNQSPQLFVSSTDSNHIILRQSSANINANKIQNTPVIEDSNSTNNSLASSSGIGGSRDCSGVGTQEENSLTSFEGILLNGAPSNLDIDAQEDGSSKDSNCAGFKDKSAQSVMLADLLERKSEKELIPNGTIGTKDLVENHIKKVRALRESDVKIKREVIEDNAESAPRLVMKRALSADCSEPKGLNNCKKSKYANGTSSPESTIKAEDAEEEKVTVSSTAANLYAALAADIIEDEADLIEEPTTKPEIKPEIKTEIKQEIKEEPPKSVAKVTSAVGSVNVIQAAASEQSQQLQQQVQVHTAAQKIGITREQLQQQLQQQGLIVPRQIVVQQNIGTGSNQIVAVPASALANVRTQNSQSQQQQVLQVPQSAVGQTHYVISGGGGQNYVLAQPQTTLLQGQPQTVLVAQQQGTNTKTIIILQPQTSSPAQAQKMVAVTPQGQQIVVTQVPRAAIQGSTVANIQSPLVSSAGTIVVNSPNVVQQVTQMVQQQVKTNSLPVQMTTQQPSSPMPVRVVTPTPAPIPTPPTSRPTTPLQQQTTIVSATKIQQIPKEIKKEETEKTPSKSEKSVPQNSLSSTTSSTTTTTATAVTAATATTTTTTTTTNTNTNTNSTSNNNARGQTPTPPSNTPKTITIKIDPNKFLCEWRGCLKQFKTPKQVYMHVCEAHCPSGNDETICQWASCDALKRRRFSLMTHLYDRHCCDEIMLARRKQLTLSGKTEVSTTTAPLTPPVNSGYAPNAAIHAIKRHALEFVNPKELLQRPSKPAAATTSSSSPRPGQNPSPEQDDNEGPVTKSIRLTAALILRNLVIYSAHGRRHLRAYEPHLAGVALSKVESSRTIAQVLYDLNDQSSSGHR